MALARSRASTRYHMLEAMRVKMLNPPRAEQLYTLTQSLSLLRSAAVETTCPTAMRRSSTVLGERRDFTNNQQYSFPN